jgi:intein/homing endonuclease
VASQISKTSDSYYIIESDSGRTVKATDEHPFFLNDDGDEDKSITIKLKNFVVMTGIYMQDGWNMLVRTVN